MPRLNYTNFPFFSFAKIIDAVVSIVRGSNLRMKDRENDRYYGNSITFFTPITKQSYSNSYLCFGRGIYKGGGERERKRERERVNSCGNSNNQEALRSQSE